MPVSTITLLDNVNAMAGGVDEVEPKGPTWKVTFGGTWAVGEEWFVEMLTTIGDLTMGSGNITKTTPRFARAYGDRVMLAIGNEWAYSAIDDPHGWEQQDIGAGKKTYVSPYSGSDQVMAFAPYQGQMIVLARQSLQLWLVDADPAQFARTATFENVGAFASDSVQPLGELEVFFGALSGVRSLRTRDATSNAFVNDLGSPIDLSVVAKLATASAAEVAAACSVVDTTANRYWLFLKDTIYVFSYYPSNKINAWAVYTAKYWDGAQQTAFVPQKFLNDNGRIYARTSNAIIAYGGTSGTAYDNTQLIVELPWLDDEEPALGKRSLGIDAALTAKWTISGGMDPYSGTLETIVTNGNATSPNQNQDSLFDLGHISFTANGTHFKLRLVSSTENTGEVKLSCLVFHYDKSIDN
jgi:hypothetical protein